MARILGIDLGTNSIGWALVNDEKGSECELLKKGARIFSAGVHSEKGQEKSAAALRTAFRSARRLKFRRKLRKYETLKVLAANKMCPISVEEVENWRKSNFKNYPMSIEFLDWLRSSDNTYYLRDQASRKALPLFQLGRAFYHIAQRRGFLSNRLDQSADGIIESHSPQLQEIIEECQPSSKEQLRNDLTLYFDDLGLLVEKNNELFGKPNKELDEGEIKLVGLYDAFKKILKTSKGSIDTLKEELLARLNRKENLGVVKGGIHDISLAMKDGGFETLGQYFYHINNTKAKVRGHYTSREEHYLKEFEIICKVQKLIGINEHKSLPRERYTGLVQDLYKAIFYQRPLRSQKGLVGKCSFEKKRARCAVSHPDFEEYRMWCYLNTIKLQAPGEKQMRFLTPEEKEKLIPKFMRKKTQFDFKELANVLIEKGARCSFYKSANKSDQDYQFNYKLDSLVSACPVSASFKNILGADWKTKEYQYQTLNGKSETVSRSVDYRDLWALLLTSTSNDYLEEYAKNKLRLSDQAASSFSKINLKKDYSSLSLYAIHKILPYLKVGLLYSHAVFMANLENMVDSSLWNDPQVREEIKKGIGNIIERYSYEKAIHYSINSLIKNHLKNEECYSKEAETIYKEELETVLNPILKKYKQGENLGDEITAYLALFIDQLQKNNGKGKFLAIERLDDQVIQFLRGKNEDGVVYCSNEQAIGKLYHPSDIQKFRTSKDDKGTIILGNPNVSSIKNPMAMRALYQLRKVLNSQIVDGVIDEKTQINIEMARELNDANYRKAIENYQKENKQNKDQWIKEIKELYSKEAQKDIVLTEDDILRYRLWKEQEYKTIYECTQNGANIERKPIHITEIIGSDPQYDIEHTIPRSRSLDNSLMNKTLCSKQFNREIKKSSIPYELNNYDLILQNVDHWRAQAEKLDKDIEKLSRGIKASTSKDAKDRLIVLRHQRRFERDYLQGKYDRFTCTEVKAGFKNSQLVDTGIITKYAQEYLRSYFERVVSVKGGMVDQFRKIWGLHGRNESGDYQKKLRESHAHHTIDAITIACMTKQKYDLLASAWTEEDKDRLDKAKEIIANSKPWASFTEDMLKIQEDLLISHYTADAALSQTKKKLRVRGKIQYKFALCKDDLGKTVVQRDEKGKPIYQKDEKGNPIPRYQQGDSIRGSLHNDTYYGAIINPNSNSKEPVYVFRKPLGSLKVGDIPKIVDEGVRRILEQAVKDKIITFDKKDKIKLHGKVWMNKGEGIEIKKVRIIARTTNPIELKLHAPLSLSKKEYKQNIYVSNEENYCMAIYEGVDEKGKRSRSSELIDLYNAGAHYKRSNSNRSLYPIVPEKDEKGRKLKYLIKKGQMVIMYDKNKEELYELYQFDKQKLYSRVYEITRLDVSSMGIKLLHHSEARCMEALKEHLLEVKENQELTDCHSEAREKKVPKLTSGIMSGKKIDEHKKYPYIQIAKNSFDCLVEGDDFSISATGEIQFKKGNEH